MSEDATVVRLTPRPGFPEHKIVSEFVCPEGHVVQAPNERSTLIISHIYPEKALVPCYECEVHYHLYASWTATEADDRTLAEARENGYEVTFDE